MSEVGAVVSKGNSMQEMSGGDIALAEETEEGVMAIRH